MMSEGELIKFCVVVVCELLFVIFVNEMDFGKLVLFGKGEEMIGGWFRLVLLVDVFEVFIGVFYLD